MDERQNTNISGEPSGGEAQKNKKRARPRGMMLRCGAVLVIFVVASAALGLRLAQLQVDEAAEWEAMAGRQQLANISIAPMRGNIYDVSGRLLAQSAAVWTIEASPDVLNQSNVKNSTETDPARVAAQQFALIFDLDEEELYEELSDEKSYYFKIIGKIEKPLADEVREMCAHYNIKGIYLTEDTKRYYPYENVASTILGFVGNDNNGLEGLEQEYEEVLAGVPGRRTAVRDPWGNEIDAGVQGVQYPAQDGNSVFLTLDVEIQRSLEKYLADAVEKHNARQRGFAIAMDVNTGAILGLAVWPSYNPNLPYDILDIRALSTLELLPPGSQQYSEAQGLARTLQWRNKALADTYEPGSVFKIITAAAALDSGIYTENDVFNCGAQIMIDGWDRPITCAGDPPTNHGTPTLRQALIDSCNVAMIRMSAGMGEEVWYNYLQAFGLTEPTGVDLPGEPSQNSMNNLVYDTSEMGPVELASCSFGQSNKYTAVQMITAVAAAVNGGNLLQPYIVDRIVDPAGNVVQQNEPVIKRQVISPEVSAQLCSILEELVSTTTNGKHAYVAGYHVGGKSGTSQKLDVMLQQQREDAFISSFVGFAPADAPQIAVLMALDEPEDNSGRNNYFGGRMVGPSVGSVIRESMQILGIEPNYVTDDELARSTVAVPGVVGSTLADAQSAIASRNLTYRMIGDGDTVIGQSPGAYSQIPYSGEVVLYTDASMPQQTVVMPDVIGTTAANALQQLRGIGLNVLMDGAPDGSAVRVETQSIEASSSVPIGTVVNIRMVDTTSVSHD